MKFHGEDDSTVTNILLVVSAVLVIIFTLPNLITLETIMKLFKPYNSAIFGYNAKDLEFDFLIHSGRRLWCLCVRHFQYNCRYGK